MKNVSLVSLLTLVCLSNSYADLKVKISPQKQEGNNCYGAVAQEILRLNGISATQRQISAKTHENNQFQGDDFKGTDLKGSGGSPLDVLRYYDLNQNARGYHPDPTTVREVLGRGDALCLSVGRMSGGHALLLFGISDDNRKFWIWDPASNAQALMSMKDIETIYGGYNYYGWVERPGGGRVTPVERPAYRSTHPQRTDVPPIPRSTPIIIPTHTPQSPQPNSWYYSNRVIVPDPEIDALLKRLDKLNNVK